MKEAWLIASRELAAYLKSPLGYIVAAAVLFLDGLLFNAFALSADNALSSDVLRAFFYFSSGLVMAASVLLSMRSFAEERTSGTLVLLFTAPLREWQIVLGKFLAAFLMLAFLVLLSIYMPMLIFVNGRVSVGQIFAGYLGLLALGACTTSMGVFASALTRSQVLAAVLSAGIIATFLVTWKMADVTSPPISDALSYLALFDKHFYPTFTKGLVNGKDLFFFAALSFVFLMGTSKVLAARRWVG
jgi:ABC-2 type transport system permease protein